MSSQMFHAAGLTCGHCVSAVTSEIQALVPDAQVEVELGSPSTITVTGAPVTDEQMAQALDEAGGYTLTAS